MKKILLLSIILLLVPIISAVEIVDFYWTNSNSDILEINYGESAQFEAYVADYNSMFSVRIFLEDDSTGEITNILSHNYNSGEAEIIREISQEDYVISGSYSLHIIVENPHDDAESWEPPLRLIVNGVQDENNPPYVPSNPNPENGAEDVSREVRLSWDGGDPDEGNIVNYDIYLNNRLICDNTRFTSCWTEILRSNTPYRWYVVASDGDLETRGPTWSFTTGPIPQNQEPFVDITSPRENQRIEGIHKIKWDAHDSDGDIVNTKIYYNKHGVMDWLGSWLGGWLGGYYTLLVDLGDSSQRDYDWDTTQFRNGRYDLKIIVTDDDNAKSEDIVENFKLFNKKPEPKNHAPEITSNPDTEVIVNTPYKYDVNAFDIDGDEITYSLVEAPRFMVINKNTGFINWLPVSVGQYLVTVKASDGKLSDLQEFTIKVLAEEEEPKEPEEEPREIHEFSISNIILDEDNEYIKVYVQVRNKGNQDEEIVLNAIIMENGERAIDSFNLEDNDNYWRILYLPKPLYGGEYTIGVWGNSEDYRDISYRSIVTY